jgi:hypothetical protein
MEKRTMDMKEFTPGEGKLIYIPRWADDPDALLPGTLVLFSNAVNQNWKHAIPQDKTAAGERISLTYREF